jgi:hypothetical protein
MAKKLNKLEKVNESFTVNRYDNGFMVEVGGRDKENDWKTATFPITASIPEIIPQMIPLRMGFSFLIFPITKGIVNNIPTVNKTWLVYGFTSSEISDIHINVGRAKCSTKNQNNNKDLKKWQLKKPILPPAWQKLLTEF